MSDQFTRVTCGGSPIPKTAPVVGLMFGTIHNINSNDNNTDTSMMNTDNDTNTEIHIHDADDTIFPLNLEDYCKKQVELHQAVFTTHITVGWYRVSLSCEPTVSDLEQTQRLRQKYAGQEILFGLLQVPSTLENKKPSAAGKKSAPDENDDDDEEEELPLTLYQVMVGGGGEALVAVPDWKIATSEAERIAVERVISEKTAVTAAGGAGSAAAAGAAFAPGVDQAAAIRAVTQAAQESSAWYQQTVLVQESWRAIQDRLDILVSFLETVQQQQADSNASNAMTMQEHFEQEALLRQVQGLLLQLGPLAATCPTSASSNKVTTLSSSLQQLSVLAKTIDAVTSYTDKFRLVQDSSAPTSSGRDIRRFWIKMWYDMRE